MVGLHNSALKVSSPCHEYGSLPKENDARLFANVTVRGQIALTGLSLDSFISINQEN